MTRKAPYKVKTGLKTDAQLVRLAAECGLTGR